MNPASKQPTVAERLQAHRVAHDATTDAQQRAWRRREVRGLCARHGLAVPDFAKQVRTRRASQPASPPRPTVPRKPRHREATRESSLRPGWQQMRTCVAPTVAPIERPIMTVAVAAWVAASAGLEFRGASVSRSRVRLFKQVLDADGLLIVDLVADLAPDAASVEGAEWRMRNGPPGAVAVAP